jgi:hypothetical protein
MRIRRLHLLLAITAASALWVAPAGAAHWPQLGGDAGRSGAQPVDEGGVPAQFLWSRTAETDRQIRTSIITSAGALADQRVIYGTDSPDADPGFVHLRLLQTGAPVGPQFGTDVSFDPAPFGSGTTGVTPVESSTATSLGQVFVLHNETFVDNSVALEIAQIDETTGEARDFDPNTVGRQDFSVPNSLTYRVASAALLSAADAAGNRSLFFVAEDRPATGNEQQQKLFKIPLGNASSPVSAFGTTVTTADINANPTASPTLVSLSNAAGVVTPYVAVSTNDGVLTFAVADLAAGPSATGIGESMQTPSVAINVDGSIASPSPAIFVAGQALGGTTTVHKLVQDGASQTLTRTSSPALAGVAAPGLAIAANGQRVLVSTSKNLYGLRTTDLTVAAKYRASDDLVANTTGFSRTIAASTGQLVAIVTDGGRQLLLERDSLQPVDADLFSPARTADGSTSSVGQPSISRRHLQVMTDRGIFVYGLRSASPPTGYWLAASDGGIFSYGDAGFFGSTGDIALNKPIVAMAATPTRQGYWLVASDGGVFTFGDAVFYGSTGDIALNKPIVGMVPTRSGLGYWLVASDGGIFSFGPDATFLGSTGDIALNKPIVGMSATPTGEGYWLVASDGGIFTFGDAPFLGSTGDIVLNKPIVGMAARPAGSGYWMVASDGGVFSFGRAGFFGSTGDIVLNSPIVAMTPSATGQGYLFTAADGGVFVFGDAPFLGAAAELGPLNKPVVTIAAKP